MVESLLPRESSRRLRFHMANMALGMAIFLCAISFVTALLRTVDEAIGNLGTDIVVISDRARVHFDAKEPALRWSTYAGLQRHFGSAYQIAPVQQLYLPIHDGRGAAAHATVWATTAELFRLAELTPAEGRLPADRDEKYARFVCAVGAAIEDAAIEASLGATIGIDAQRCKIIGRLAQTRLAPAANIERSIFVPMEAMATFGSLQRRPLTQIYLRSRDGELDPNFESRLREALADADLTRIDVWSAKEFWQTRRLVISRLSLLTLGIAIVIVTLAATGLAGGLMHDVSARRAEIGLRISLGATRHDIFRMVLREGCWIVIGGGAIGVAAGLFFVAAIINPLASEAEIYAMTLRIGVHPGAIAISFTALLLAALAASYFPARDAARTDPSLAIRGLQS